MTTTPKTKTYSVIPKIRDSEFFSGHIIPKHPNPRWKLRAQQRVVFESGFTGLTITSLVWVERLLLNVAFIARSLADVLRIGEKKGMK